MAYKFSKGNRGFGDITFEEDPDTGIDFEDNTIKLETGGAERLVVTDNGIGIGTASPDTLVHLKGTSPAITLQRNNNSNDSSMINFEGQAGSVACQIGQVAGTANELAFSTHDGSLKERMRIDVDGKVGIGTANPTTNLHVSGEDGRIRVEGTSGNHPGIELAVAGTRKWIVYNDPDRSDNLAFKTNTNVRMSIKQDGNVGIGTDNPVELATIEGVIAVREGNAPGNTANYGKLYVKSTDHNLYFKNNTGTETNLLGGGGGSDNLGNHTATQDLIMGNYSLKSTGGSLSFKSEPNSATPLYVFKKNGNSAPGNSVNLSLEGGTGNNRIVLKTDQNLNNDYDITLPNAQPSTGKVLKVNSYSSNNAVLGWTDALPNVGIPANAGSNGIKGQIAFDTSYFYVCVADNSWKRIGWPSW